MKGFLKKSLAALLISWATVLTSSSPNTAHAEEATKEVTTKEVNTKAAIFGRVVNDEGTAVAGVSIILGDGDRVYARTNGEGRYKISGLDLKAYPVRAAKPGFTFSPELRVVKLPTTGKPTFPDAESNFKATQLKSLAISGLIRTSGGKALAKVVVTLSSENFTSRTASTNADGIYEFGKLPYGKFTVTPRLNGYKFDPEKRNITIPTKGGEFAPHGRANFVAKPLETEKPAGISGSVKTPAGAGVAGVAIYLNDRTAPSATTNSDGKYSIPALGKGTFIVKPKRTGAIFDPESRTVTLPTTGLDSSPSAIANFLFKEVPVTRYVIRGKVTGSGGVSVSGVGIYLGDAATPAATTNSEGRYAIEKLVSGRYVVKAKKEGGTYLPASKVVELPTSGLEASPDGVANFEQQEQEHKYTIRGKVVGAGTGGVGVSGVSIFIGDNAVAVATTNTEGQYEIDDLPAGRYVLSAKKEGVLAGPPTRVVELPTSGLEVSPNGIANFEIQVPSTKYAIKGKVTGGTGAALANVNLFIGDVLKATTNAEGRYAIEGLVAGTYTVIPKRERFTFEPVNKTVTVPTTEGSIKPHAEANFVGTETNHAAPSRKSS